MKDNTIQIENGVPVPPLRRNVKYPFAKMDVGDSFFVPRGNLNSISVRATYFKSKNPGTDFRVSAVAEEVDGKKTKGVRVWRLL